MSITKLEKSAPNKEPVPIRSSATATRFLVLLPKASDNAMDVGWMAEKIANSVLLYIEVGIKRSTCLFESRRNGLKIEIRKLPGSDLPSSFISTGLLLDQIQITLEKYIWIVLKKISFKITCDKLTQVYPKIWE